MKWENLGQCPNFNLSKLKMKILARGVGVPVGPTRTMLVATIFFFFFLIPPVFSSVATFSHRRSARVMPLQGHIPRSGRQVWAQTQLTQSQGSTKYFLSGIQRFSEEFVL